MGTITDANQVKLAGRVFGDPIADKDPVSGEPRLLCKLETNLRRRIGRTKGKETRKARLDVVIYGIQEGSEYLWLQDQTHLVLTGWMETTKRHPAYPNQEWTAVVACLWKGVKADEVARRRRLQRVDEILGLSPQGQKSA